MSRSLTIVDDGGATAEALAAWLTEQVPGAQRVTAAAADVERVIGHRRRARLAERIVAVTARSVEGADLDASDALAIVDRWLAELDPFARRVRGSDTIAARVTGSDPGAMVVRELARRVATRSLPELAPPAQRGRPRGSRKPFEGVGFDLSVVLLLRPDQTWTERALARAIDRSAYGVHRALGALDELGFLERERGATGLRSAIALRDSLAAAWRERMRDRRATWWLAPRLDHAAEDAMAAIEGGALLAGPSATSSMAGGVSTIYAPRALEETLSKRGFVRAGAGRGQLVVWEPSERAVLAWPRRIAAGSATNRVVTYLDLMALGTDRYESAARDVWNEDAP